MTKDTIEEAFQRAEAAVAKIDKELKEIEALLNDGPIFGEWA